MNNKEVWYRSRRKVGWEKWVQYFRLTKEVFQKMDTPIIEAGCGPGAWVHYADSLGKTCVGLDFDVKTLTESVDTSGKLEHSSFVGGDVTALPFKDNVCNGYISLGVIEHFDDNTIEKTFQEASRVLTPQGTAFFLIPNGRAFWRRILTAFTRRGWSPQEKFSNVHERWDLTLDNLCSIAESCGFHVADKGTSDFWYNFYAPVKYLLGRDVYSLKNIIMHLDFLGRIFKKSGTSLYVVVTNGEKQFQVAHGFSVENKTCRE